MRILSYSVPEEYSGKTIESFLKEQKGYSSSNISQLKQIKGGAVLNGLYANFNKKVYRGDALNIYLDSEDYNIINLDVGVLYNDRDAMLISKPAGMAVHRCAGHFDDALDSFIVSKKSYGNSALRIINRLDRDTSGIVALAKHSYAAFNLKKTITKLYYGIINGKLQTESGIINMPIHENKDNSRRYVGPGGKSAVTAYRTLYYNGEYSLLEFRMHTGRTHQIRVHMSAIGHPLCGDDLYGGDMSAIKRQALHCGKIIFTQPVTGEKVEISDNLPEDFRQLIPDKYKTVCE